MKNIAFVLLLFLFNDKLFSQDFQFGKLIYSNPLNNENDVRDWIMEGPRKIEFVDNTMQMYSPNEVNSSMQVISFLL